MPETKTAARPAAQANGGRVLSVKDLQAWYGESHILHGIDFHVNEGEVVTLLGRNGAGKTTTLKSIMGIVRDRKAGDAAGVQATPTLFINGREFDLKADLDEWVAQEGAPPSAPAAAEAPKK